MIKKLLEQRCNLKLSEKEFKELCKKTTEFIKNNEIKNGYLTFLDQLLMCMYLIYQRDIMWKLFSRLNFGGVGK